MIDIPADRSRSVRRLWSGTVQHVFQSLELQDRSGAQDIAESVAVFCEEHPHMPGHTLSLLMARSFCATGDRDSAHRVLRQDQTHRPHAESWLELLSSDYPFPELYPFFSSRTLRPLQLNTVSAGKTWVLDLEKITLTDADRHELILLKTLRILTEKVSHVWKNSDGQGTLVLKGFPRLSHFVLPGNSRITASFLTYIQDVLVRCGEKNGWSEVPAVLLLDL